MSEELNSVELSQRVNGEVVDARKDSVRSKIYSSLKDRLDAIDQRTATITVNPLELGIEGVGEGDVEKDTLALLAAKAISDKTGATIMLPRKKFLLNRSLGEFGGSRGISGIGGQQAGIIQTVAPFMGSEVIILSGSHSFAQNINIHCDETPTVNAVRITGFGSTLKNIKTNGGNNGVVVEVNEVFMSHCLFKNAVNAGVLNRYVDLVGIDISTESCGYGYYGDGNDGARATTLFHFHAIYSKNNGFYMANSDHNFIFGCESDTSNMDGFYMENCDNNSIQGHWSFKSSKSSPLLYSDYRIIGGFGNSFIAAQVGGDSQTKVGWHLSGDQSGTLYVAPAGGRGIQVDEGCYGFRVVSNNNTWARYDEHKRNHHFGHAIANGETTIPRQFINNSAALVSGELSLTYFTAMKDEIVTSIRMMALTSPTGNSLVRAGLYEVNTVGDLTLVAATSNDINVFTTANFSYNRAVSPSGYIKKAGQRYALGILQIATTTSQIPAIVNVLNATESGVNPRITGYVSGVSDLPLTIKSSLVVHKTPSAQFYSVILP